MNHPHFDVSITGVGPSAQFVNAMLVVVACEDGTLAMTTASCLPVEAVVETLRELADKTEANGLNHVETRVEP